MFGNKFKKFLNKPCVKPYSKHLINIQSLAKEPNLRLYKKVDLYFVL